MRPIPIVTIPTKQQNIHIVIFFGDEGGQFWLKQIGDFDGLKILEAKSEI